MSTQHYGRRHRRKRRKMIVFHQAVPRLLESRTQVYAYPALYLLALSLMCVSFNRYATKALLSTMYELVFNLPTMASACLSALSLILFLVVRDMSGWRDCRLVSFMMRPELMISFIPSWCGAGEHYYLMGTRYLAAILGLASAAISCIAFGHFLVSC